MANPSFMTPEQYADYKKKLVSSMYSVNVAKEKIKEILAYADELYKHQLPIIFDQPHLAGLLGYELDYLQILSNCQKDFYKEFKMLKRNKKDYRVIHEPLPNLKEIQTWILDNILLSPGTLKLLLPVVTAFVPQRSIIDNAKYHVGKRIVLCMDLKDFFSSVHLKQVYRAFREMGYGRDVSGMLANLCTYEKTLPQGAPTSPMLSNLVISHADKLIQVHCELKGISYTRYADDLTFSSEKEFDYGNLIGYVTMVMEKSGFSINSAKTKVFHRNQSQNVTGIVVNELMQVCRKYRKKIRQEMYYLQHFGLTKHYLYTNYPYGPQSYLNHLLGKVNHVLHVNREDKEMLRYRKVLKIMIKETMSHVSSGECRNHPFDSDLKY